MLKFLEKINLLPTSIYQGIAQQTKRGALFFTGAIISAGLMVVSVSYSSAQKGLPYSDLIYWAGLLLQFLPATYAILRRSVKREEALGIVVYLGFSLYLTKILVDPSTFSFMDEMQQWRSVQNSLDTSRLFMPNPILEVSPYYPGLSNITHALVSITNLNIHDAGVILIGVIRLMLMISLFLFFETISRSHRIGGLSTLLYMCNPAFLGWTSYFIYQSLALPLAFLALYCIIRLNTEDPQARRGLIVSILIIIPAIVITHHVTAIIFAILLILFAIIPPLWVSLNTTRNWNRAAKIARKISPWLSRRVALFWILARQNKSLGYEKNKIGWLAVLTITFIYLWITFVATPTSEYLGGQIGEIINEIIHFKDIFTRERTAAPLPDLPAFELIMAYGSMIILLLGVPFGMIQTLRKLRGDSLAITMVTGSSTLFLVFIVRFTSARGGEILGRTWPFLYVVIALVLSIGILFLIDIRNKIKWPARISVLLTILILFIGGIASGWPPYWARLPGEYIVGGGERAVDIYGLNASNWANQHLEENSIMASDFMLHHMLGSYGMQSPIMGMGDLFINEYFSKYHSDLINEYGLEYLVVDTRMAEEAPKLGFYYGSWEDISYTNSPVPIQFITKYDSVSGVNRIYDSGAILFYDIQELLEQ